MLRTSHAVIVALTLMLAITTAMPVAAASTGRSAQPEASTRQATGPLAAYVDSAGGRIIVEDFGANTIRDYPYGGFDSPVWSPDGQRLLVVERNRRALVYEVFTGKITEVAVDFAPCCEDSDERISYGWAANNEVMLPTGRNGTVIGVDIFTLARRTVLDFGPGATVTAAPTSPDGTMTSTGTCSNTGCTFGLYSTASGELVFDMPDDAGWLTFHPDGTTVAYGGFTDDRITTVNLTTRQSQVVFDGPYRGVNGLLYTPDGNELLFAVWTGSRYQMATTDAQACCDAFAFDAGVDGIPVDISPDGQYVSSFDDYGEGAEGIISRVGHGRVLPPAGSYVGIARFAPPPPPAPPAPPTDPAGVIRLAGPSRVQTATAISTARFPDRSAPVAVVATDGNFADAQTATPLIAGRGPVLLSAAAALHPDTAAELDRVLTEDAIVYVVGGTAALSDRVVADIETLGHRVVRLAGTGRAETSVAIARELTDRPTEIFLVDGGAFPPGVIASAIAGGRTGAVVVSGPAGAAYAEEFSDVTVHGVGDFTFSESVTDVRHTAGSPTALSVRLAEEFLPSGGQVALASAESFPDGLAGSADAAARGIPILLTPRDTLPADLDSYLSSRGVTELVVYGGPAAIDPAVTSRALH